MADQTTTPRPTEKRMPLTLLTGFLGAGKSTLLNKLLATPEAGRVAVIVNEFGEVGLDHDLIESSSDEVILMASGCLCCSIRGDLADTVAQLLMRRARGELSFDRIVIETTGLADPAPIQQTVLTDRILSRAVYLDGLVTVVDCANGPQTLDAQFEAVSQVATADLILLSKTDLVMPAEVDALTARLRGLNATAEITPVATVTDSPQRMWGLSGVRRDVGASDAVAWLSAPVSARSGGADPLANLSGLAPAPATDAPHDSRISSVSIVIEEPLQDAIFDVWLDTLIAMRGPQILRVKGIVFLQGIDHPFVFHGVQHIFDPPVPLRDWPAGDTTSRIVVIARDMTSPELSRSLDMLRSEIAPDAPPPLFPGWQPVTAKERG